MNENQPLLTQIKACTLCADQLNNGVRPILQISRNARILIAGQAPGSQAHASGVPFDDQSGERLRDWMGINQATFYDPYQVAIVPMGFCYPGQGKSGDLPPIPLCAETWRARVLRSMPKIQLTLAIGQYAQAWHLPHREKTLTDTVQNWRTYGDQLLPLPHPSPRNNIWLSKHSWFETDVLPHLKHRVQSVLTQSQAG